jgi:hypothetical protein
MLAMLSDTMMPEAFAEAHNFAGLITVLGFLARLFSPNSRHNSLSPGATPQIQAVLLMTVVLRLIMIRITRMSRISRAHDEPCLTNRSRCQ